MEILERGGGVACICGQELRGREEDQPSPSTGWTLYLSPPNNLCPEKQFELTLTTAAGPARSVPTTTLPPSTIVIPPRRKSCLGITNGVRGTFCFHRSATGKELEFRQQEMYRWLQKPAASCIRIVSDSTIRCLQSNGATGTCHQSRRTAKPLCQFKNNFEFCKNQHLHKEIGVEYPIIVEFTGNTSLWNQPGNNSETSNNRPSYEACTGEGIKQKSKH